MSDGEEPSESEFYFPDELEFQGQQRFDRNNERVGERQNEGNSKEEVVDIFFLRIDFGLWFSKMLTKFSFCNVIITFYTTFLQL